MEKSTISDSMKQMAERMTSTSGDSAKTYCKHYYGRVVKDVNGIPYGYERGCLANHNVDKECCMKCIDFEPMSSDSLPSYKITQTSDGSYTFYPNSSSVTDAVVDTREMPRDRYEGRIFPKNYSKKRKAKARQRRKSRKQNR